MRPAILFAGVVAMVAAVVAAQDRAPAPAAAPAEETVSIRSTKDGATEPAIFYCPEEAKPGGKKAAPLLVGLHTWSFDYKQGSGYLGECRRRGWVLIAPNFRGVNNRPEACASELAIQDVLDAVEYARKNANVDEKRIYLTGWSGGGHMAMMMAAKAPKLWAGVSVWVPISDLAKWHEQVGKASGYARNLEVICGGAPGDAKADPQYRARSPLWVLEQAKDLPFDINGGIKDGTVPFIQSIWAFNALAKANGHAGEALTDEQIRTMTGTKTVPAELVKEWKAEPRRRSAILFRREAGAARLTLFDGGHEVDVSLALDWLAGQSKQKAGVD